MAIVRSSRVNNGGVDMTLHLSFDEVSKLGGCLQNIHVISEQRANETAPIYTRGKNSKYFLIPKAMRKDVAIKSEASCCSMVTKKKIVWAYFMDRI